MRAYEFIKQDVTEDIDNLPSVLYHATYKPRLKSIKLKGLGAGGNPNWEDSKPGVVYLALNPSVAESYAETSDSVPEEWLDEIIILKISTAGLDLNKFYIDSNVQDNTGATLEYHGVIPASNISLYDQGVAEDTDFRELLKQPQGDKLITNVPKFLFHATPSKNIDSIKSKGLELRSDNPQDRYEPRIYVAGTVIDALKIANQLRQALKSKQDYTILKINTSGLKNNFYVDPYYSGGAYTDQNISPDSISVELEIPKEAFSTKKNWSQFWNWKVWNKKEPSFIKQGVAEDTQHNSQDLEDVAHWMRTTPDKLNIVVKQEPIEKFIKQIREMHGTYDEFPEDEARTNRILKLLKRGAKPLPMYVEEGDPDLFVMEGRHRMVAFWLAGMKTIPVAYVSVKDQQGVAESTQGVTPTGYTWSFEHGGEVPYKSDVEANTFIRVRDGKGKTVLGVWADVYGEDVEIQYSEVFDKKLRGKGIYTDFLKGLSKHYNIISDQDQNNAARNIYKKLGADYNRKTEKHTLRRSSQGVAEGILQEIFTVPAEKIFLLVKNIHGRKNDFDEGDISDRIYWFDDYKLDRLPISKINLHQWDVDESYVDELVDNIINKKQKIRPIIFDPIENSIIDGIHRANAYAKLGHKYIPAYIGHTKSNSYGQREDDELDEMALKTYKTMGDFSKPGPFTGADKKLVPHPKNIEKATKFFEKTPFDFRLFFSHLKGTGKYSEHGPMSPDEIRKVFGQDAEEIINGSEDAITVVYVGNKGDAKVMLTPWMMAHRLGHAINRGPSVGAWKEAEKYFFQTVNALLAEHYSKVDRQGASSYMGRPKSEQMNYNLTPEYNALFNAMGTQRSSKSGEIRRPYEFFYELFAQYLGTGKVTLNPLPTNLTYGRKAWGNPTKYMNIKPEYRDELSRKEEADRLSYTMELLFNSVLSDSVGKIFVM